MPTPEEVEKAHKILYEQGLKIRYEVAGKPYVDSALANGSSAPTLFGANLPVASLGAATTWTVQATDSSGASSAVVNGSDQWSCW